MEKAMREAKRATNRALREATEVAEKEAKES
jgi:hypothetical protein